MKDLFSFHGGVKAASHKSESNQQPIKSSILPHVLTVPLRQHTGSISKPLVKAGDHVLKGQMIGKPDGYMSAAIHAPTSGRVLDIDNKLVPHPSGLLDLCVLIESDGEDRWINRRETVDYKSLHPKKVYNLLRSAGVVGLGGAVVPTAVKLNTSTAIDTLILNGSECGPWITCDDLLMRERASEIISGLHIIVHILQPREVLVSIEDDKPQAISEMEAACSSTSYRVVKIPTRYPSGSVKQLVALLTGREIPINGLPVDIGVQCFNVGTAYAVHRTIEFGEPVISRVVTITGHVNQPQNMEVLFGTPFSHLINQSGGYRYGVDQLIMGGPMMGFAVHDDQVPVIKATNCIFAARVANFTLQYPVRPCIRCGVCVDVCPMNLLPQQLYWYARAKELDRVKDYHLFSCIECGCCSYVCPSHIPLVQYYRYAKSEIWAQEKEKQKADLARRRYRARVARLEHKKQIREAKLQEKAPVLMPNANYNSRDM